jgi:tRNA(fMet)-specific endonuclease VapC
MSEIIVDTNAAVDFMRGDSTALQRYRIGWSILLPVHVVGELFFGAFSSQLAESNIAIVEDLARTWNCIAPNRDTARFYGRLRAREAASLSPSKLNDLWIAALCLQHDLPLLTNDHGFDHIAGLTVIHW